jgi:dolichol-phosphate mannosyltransferase
MNADDATSAVPIAQMASADLPELAVIVPVFNEVDNVAALVDRLSASLGDIPYEVIFVDDNSPDGTADAVRALARDHANLRCLQRFGRRGLSSAVIEGFLATAAPVLAVIDGDLQHDETILPQMLDLLRRENVDLVVGSRYVAGGGVGDWSHKRQRMSRAATLLSRHLAGVELSDPMSGFFMLRAEALRARVDGLSGIGYKILLDILSARGAKLTTREVPYQFRVREAGQSKLDHKVVLEFIELLIARTVGRWIPTKFVMFSMVGAFGVLVHLAILSLLFGGGLAGFPVAQAAATLVAMTVNFFVNNFFTYFDRQLRGWALLPGWLTFCAASAVGALANVGLAVFLFEKAHFPWVPAAVAGIIIGATWNYVVTALYTWKDRR